MDIQNAILSTTEQLKKYSDTSHLDAELLVMEVTQQTREHLIAYPETALTSHQQKELEKLTQRRIRGEPIAYILGHKEFWSLDLKVTPDTLIPRPETEHLVEWALNNLPAEKNICVADLGAGSGAIAIALAHERSHWTIDATEKYPEALSIAKHNAQRLQLSNINFYSGSWCKALPHHDYTAILCNPPYVTHGDPHLENLKYEPRHALDGGKEGLDSIKIIIRQAKNYLEHKGYLILEHGYDQAKKIKKLLHENGYQNIQDHRDLAGQPRFATATTS